MSELNLDNGSVFVDVNAGQQYPLLFSALGNNEENNVDQQTEPKSEKDEAASALEDPNEDSESSPKNSSTTKEKPTRLKCPECIRYTTDCPDRLLRHIRRTHQGENPYQCSMCDYSTYNSAVFKEHVNRHQGLKPYKCSQCNYSSASKKNAKKHEFIHRPDNPLRCPHCTFIARNTRVLDAHARKEHTKTNNCIHCKKTYETKDSYLKHKTKYKCKKCPFTTCKQSILTKHREEKHSMKVKVEKYISKGFACQLCEWTSNSIPRILLHLIHHPKQVVDRKLIDVSVLERLGIMTPVDSLGGYDS